MVPYRPYHSWYRLIPHGNFTLLLELRGLLSHPFPLNGLANFAGQPAMEMWMMGYIYVYIFICMYIYIYIIICICICICICLCMYIYIYMYYGYISIAARFSTWRWLFSPDMFSEVFGVEQTVWTILGESQKSDGWIPMKRNMWWWLIVMVNDG